MDSFPEPFLDHIRHYVYLEEGGHYVLCGDNAKFMNHAEDPNCTDADPQYTVARRAIEAGEELTCDYREFDIDCRTFGLSFLGTAPSNRELLLQRKPGG